MFPSARFHAWLTLPARPFQAGAINAELDEAHHFCLRYVGGAAILAAEADVRRVRAEHIDFAQYFPFWRKLHHGAFAMPRHVKVAGRVAAHAIDAIIVAPL